MLLITLLAGLTGCSVYHREASGDTTSRGFTTAHGADLLVHDELAQTALAKASPDMPVTLTLTPEGEARINVGYGFGAMSSGGDWYGRAAAAQAYYVAQTGGGVTPTTVTKTADADTTISALDVALDVNVPCPKDREPKNVAEQLGCHTEELDAHDAAIEAGRAVR